MTEPSAKEFHDRADVSAQRVAKVYAEALLNVADQTGQTLDVLDELDSLIGDVYENEPRLEVLFSSAAMGRYHRQEALEKAFGGRASDTFLNFLLVLNHHERLDLLRSIRHAAHELNDRRNRRLRVIVSTAVTLPEDLRQRLENGVRNHFDLEPVMFLQVEPALLGGLKLRIGDMLYDASLRSKLDTLRHQILARSNHEIQSGRDRFCIDQGN